MPQPIERSQALTVLLDLTDYLLRDESTAQLTQHGLWHLDPEGMRVRLVSHVYADDPHGVLDKLQAHLGGQFVPDDEALDADRAWHRLTITWHGVELELVLAARRRVEQRHQIEDPAVPALAMAEPVGLPAAWTAGASA